MHFGRFAAPAVALLAGLSYVYDHQEASDAYLTAPIERGRIVTFVRASGAVAAVETVDVSSQLSGRIGEVFVGFNDSVAAGQPIAQLDQDIFAAQVKEADAALRVAHAQAQLRAAAVARAKATATMAQSAKELAEEQSAALKVRQDEAERELRRKTLLARTGSGSERDLDQAQTLRNSGAADLRAALAQVQVKTEAIAIAEAEAQMAEADLANAQAVVEQKQAALAQAKADYDRTVIRAPIAGIVIKRDVNPGQTVAVSLEAKTLFTIAHDLRQMEVDGKIDEADVGQVKQGQAVQFTVDAFPDRTFTGQVLQIRKAPEVVQNVVTYTVIISAPNPDQLLLPGMTAELRIEVSDSGEVLKIPDQALRFRPKDESAAYGRSAVRAASGGGATVWVAGADGRPRPVAVKIGASDDAGAALVDGGLSEGQPVIVGTASRDAKRGPFGLRMGF